MSEVRPADYSLDDYRVMLQVMHKVRDNEMMRDLLLADLIAKAASLPDPQREELIAASATAFLPAFVKSQLGRVMMPNILDSQAAARRCDVLIITVKSAELYATQIAFDVDPDGLEAETQDALPYWEVDLATARTKSLRVAITTSGRDSDVSMANFVSSILSTYGRPRLVALVGMAAGVSDLSFGDVVVATKVTDYLHGRATHDGLRTRPNDVVLLPPVDRRVDRFDPIRNFQFRDKWAKLIDTLPDYYRSLLPVSFDSASVPSILKGTIIAGNQLIEDGGLDRWRTTHDDKTRAGEMEGYGFATACKERGLPWFVARGVADYGDYSDDQGRPKDWQFAATCAAATVARQFIESYY